MSGKPTLEPRALIGALAVWIFVSGACASIAGIADIVGVVDGGGTEASWSAPNAPNFGLPIPGSGAGLFGSGSSAAGQPSGTGGPGVPCAEGGISGIVTFGAVCAGNTPVCLNGACVACQPYSGRCSAQQPQQCDSTGSWQDSGDACSADKTCNGGACTGVCGPGQTSCNEQQPLICGAMGQWKDNGDACAGQTCTSGICTGVCTSGSGMCADATPQTCTSRGQWEAGTPCNGTKPYCVSGSCYASTASCVTEGPGITDCGTASESCCTSQVVSGGSYFRTYMNGGSGPTGEADPATISSFRLDKYLVTVGRFRQFVNAWNNGTGWIPPAGSGKHAHLNGGLGLIIGGNGSTYEPGWIQADNIRVGPTAANIGSCSDSTWTATVMSNEHLPINCVNWWESYAFCIWDGGFLPSEAEWEYAAAGGSQEREYPWGTAAPGASNQYEIYNCYYPGGIGTTNCTGVSNIAPVGFATQGVSLWGQFDMTGELFEWCLDSANTYANPCTDCAYAPDDTNPRSVRSGSNYFITRSPPMPPNRAADYPQLRSGGDGFRCARTVQ